MSDSYLCDMLLSWKENSKNLKSLDILFLWYEGSLGAGILMFLYEEI